MTANDNQIGTALKGLPNAARRRARVGSCWTREVALGSPRRRRDGDVLPHVAGSAGAVVAVAACATGGAPTTRGAGASEGGATADDEAPDGHATELAGEGVGAGSVGEARSKRQSGRRSRADQAHLSNRGGRRGGVPHDVRAADASGADRRGDVDAMTRTAADRRGATGLCNAKRQRRDRLQQGEGGNTALVRH